MPVQNIDIKDDIISNDLEKFGFQSTSVMSKDTEVKIEKFVDIQKKMESMVVSENLFVAKKYSSQLKIDYKKELNSSQFIAATSLDGPVIIIAGAGSGKTRTLVYRMAYMLEQGIPPEKILLLTFTRKASGEMIERANSLLDKSFNVSSVVGSTFHSYANMMLRKYGKMIEVKPSFSIMDSSDSADALDLCAKNLDLRVSGSDFPKKAFLQKVVSQAKNWDIGITKALYKESKKIYEKFHDEFIVLDKEYAQFKKERNLFDFDDLMLVFRDGLKNFPAFRAKVQGLSDYVMVDEFQDTNVVQKEIVDILVEKHKNLMVVGDDAQSIYMFRGANVENVFKMIETYPDAKVVKIEQNYRSTEGILNFANGITDKACLGFKKNLFSNHKDDSPPYLMSSFDTEKESFKIAQSIQRLIKSGTQPDNIAIIARSSFHTNFAQLFLMQMGIDFIVMGGKKFIERKHVKDMIAYLKIIDNPYDEVAWHRVLEMIPSIGKATASKVVSDIRSNHGQVNFDKYKKKKFYPWLHDIQVLFEERFGKKLHELVDDVLEHFLILYEETAKDPNVSWKRMELGVLVKIAESKVSLKKFLNDLTLDPPDTVNKDGQVVDKKKGKVVISTVHSSKGLEFENVFIPCLLDGMFPSSKAFGNVETEEEERRIFYVACTRAKNNLILSYPHQHVTHTEVLNTPSRFLLEAGMEYFRKYN